MNKATAWAPANIAFVKYWGRRNDDLVLPVNNSVSMNLDGCFTVTTVEFGDFGEDEVRVKFFGGNYQILNGDKKKRVMDQISRISKACGINKKVKVWSENSFPADVGIASSASGFAALTVASYGALDKKLSEKALTIETRLSGSGSAARSIPNGFVEWKMGESKTGEDSYAYSVAGSKYWDLADVVAVVSYDSKEVGSYQGHKAAKNNEYMRARLVNINKRISQVKTAIKKKDLQRLGEVVEEEAISLQAVAMLSKPPIYYLRGASMEIMLKVRKWRQEGLKGYFTFDAGPSTHIICESKDAAKIADKLKRLPGVKKIFINRVGGGAKIINKHLF